MEHSETNKKLILITDFIEQKLRKEKELEFYEQELKKLEEKMYWLKREITLNNTIIEMIQQESVYDIQQGLLEKFEDGE